jgi:hypothetical protein
MDILLTNESDAIFINAPLTREYTTQAQTDVVGQRLLIMLQTFMGEWFLDEAYGIPFFQRILGHKISKDAVDLIFQQKILAEVGVQELVSFTSTLANRAYSLTFTVKVSSGDVTAPITIIA